MNKYKENLEKERDEQAGAMYTYLICLKKGYRKHVIPAGFLVVVTEWVAVGRLAQRVIKLSVPCGVRFPAKEQRKLN